MASKMIYSALASLLFIQTAFSQCIRNQGNIASINNIGLGNNIINSGASIIGNNNLGLARLINSGASIISNNLGLIESPIYGNSGIFSVSSGSPAYNFPSGVLVNSENQISGQVAVVGNVPLLGAAYFGGEVPSDGESVLTYGAGPSVSLNGGGCGYSSYNQGLISPIGLGVASIVNNGLGSSIISNGLGGASIISNGLVGNGCGCGNTGFYY